MEAAKGCTVSLPMGHAALQAPCVAPMAVWVGTGKGMMAEEARLVAPAIQPPLDPGFRPAVLAQRAFQREVEESGASRRLVFGLERPGGWVSRYEMRVFGDDPACPAGQDRAAANLFHAERVLKFLLWQRGAWRVFVGGPRAIGEALRRIYRPGGRRAFDAHLLGDRIYRRRFTVVPCSVEEVPEEREREYPLGRHLDGYRIGFDLGASDLKISAVVEGEAVYSQEMVWEPRHQTDPVYHYEFLKAALERAAAQMPRLDAIGGSSAGVLVDSQPMVASLFRGVPEEREEEVRSLFDRIREEWGVPLVVLNDGHVAALAGSMSLEDDPVLGIAMGSSQAGGYVTPAGNLTDWLDELSFCPVDYQPGAPVEGWSGDRGGGGLYFSQQCVFRLAPEAGLSIAADVPDAEKLAGVQEELEKGQPGAVRIWQTMGVTLGYALAHYADFYRLRHVLLLGRCTSGRGGPLLVEGAGRVLQAEFPQLAGQLQLHLPDEQSRRVGQAIAAASLPAIRSSSGR
jgi:predicted NBD/HSP70 family sugar kinase